MSDVAGASSFYYDAAGNLKYKFYPDGMNNAYDYDADGRVTSMESIKNNGLFHQWFTQGYDAAGNITSKHESTGLYSTSYSYDPLNRLTGENIGGYGNIAYAYDHTGNRTTLTSPATGTTNYSYNNAGQLTSEINNGATTNYSYNNGGALLSKTTGSDTTSYSYNGMDKVTQVQTPATTVNYSYDALGRRIRRIEGTDTRNIHLNGKSDLADYWSNPWGVFMSIGRGPDGVISLTLNPGTNPMPFYQLYSPHGDVTIVDDANGNQVWGARYDSFGNVIAGEPNLYYGYLGKYERNLEMATHTVEMGVRDYDPKRGRFISADPLKGDANNPQMRNRYSYVGNNPLTYVDLDGKNAAAVVGVGAIVAISAELTIFNYSYNNNQSVEESHRQLARALDRGAELSWEQLKIDASASWNGIESIYASLNGPHVEGVQSDRGQDCTRLAEEADQTLDDMLDQSDRNNGEITHREGKATDEFDKLTRGRKGGKTVPTYRGKGKIYDDGTEDGLFIGIRRGVDEDGTPTVEINKPGKGHRKFKYKEW